MEEAPRTKAGATLWEALGSVPDHRRAEGKRYPLASLLLIAIAAMLAGRRDQLGIVRWGRKLSAETLAAIGIERSRVPAPSVWCELFRDLNIVALEQALGVWVRGGKPAGHVAIDGKRLRGSATATSPGAHLLAAFSTGLEGVIGQLHQHGAEQPDEGDDDRLGRRHPAGPGGGRLRHEFPSDARVGLDAGLPVRAGADRPVDHHPAGGVPLAQLDLNAGAMHRTEIREAKVTRLAANRFLLGGGIDGATHRAAGPELLAEWRTLGRCCRAGQDHTRLSYPSNARHPRLTGGSAGVSGGPALLQPVSS